MCVRVRLGCAYMWATYASTRLLHPCVPRVVHGCVVACVVHGCTVQRHWRSAVCCGCRDVEAGSSFVCRPGAAMHRPPHACALSLPALCLPVLSPMACGAGLQRMTRRQDANHNTSRVVKFRRVGRRAGDTRGHAGVGPNHNLFAARALLQKLKCPRLRKRSSGGGCRGGRSCASCAGAPCLPDYLPLYLRHVGASGGLCVLVCRLLLPPRFRRRMGRHRRALASWSSPFPWAEGIKRSCHKLIMSKPNLVVLCRLKPVCMLVCAARLLI